MPATRKARRSRLSGGGYVLARSSVLWLRRCSCRRPTVDSRLGSVPRRPGRPMAESLLDRIHAELRARVDELAPAIAEYEQLQAAHAALAGLAPAQPSDER